MFWRASSCSADDVNIRINWGSDKLLETTGMDNEIDSLLLRQFSSMATQDRDVLIAEFRRLLGSQLNELACSFYLEMNNWNLQDAICSYLEYSNDSFIELPAVKVYADDGRTELLTGQIPSPSLLPPNASHVMNWHIVNSGREWPPGCCLRFISGTQMASVDRILIPSLSPGSSHFVALSITSPTDPGLHTAQWRLSTFTGTPFGEPLWVAIQVSDAVAMAMMPSTEMMSQVAVDDGEMIEMRESDVPPHDQAVSMQENRSEDMTPPVFSAMPSSNSADPMDQNADPVVLPTDSMDEC